jgi:hypothetical protein
MVTTAAMAAKAKVQAKVKVKVQAKARDPITVLKRRITKAKRAAAITTITKAKRADHQ